MSVHRGRDFWLNTRSRERELERARHPQYQGPVTGESVLRLCQRQAIAVECESCEDPKQKILVTLYPTKG